MKEVVKGRVIATQLHMIGTLMNTDTPQSYRCAEKFSLRPSPSPFTASTFRGMGRAPRWIE
jgi:hypothetical protein